MAVAFVVENYPSDGELHVVVGEPGARLGHSEPGFGDELGVSEGGVLGCVVYSRVGFELAGDGLDVVGDMDTF